LAAGFKNAGITAAVTYSGGSGSMNLPFVAGQCVAYGLNKEEALQTVTLNPARILGIDSTTGSIEVGKDANIVVSEGDMLDIRTNKINYSYISGRSINLDNKHKRLYRKFSEKYGQVVVE
jgi:imidazolonepropionase-like amidohydrolase